MLHHIRGCRGDKRIPLFGTVVFVNCGKNIELCQGRCHLKGTDRIHIGSDNRHARPGLTGMFKGELTFEFNV